LAIPTVTARGHSRLSIEDQQVTLFVTPSDPPTTTTRMELRIWEKDIDEFVKQKRVSQGKHEDPILTRNAPKQ
jgi:hypothetical protein